MTSRYSRTIHHVKARNASYMRLAGHIGRVDRVL